MWHNVCLCLVHSLPISRSSFHSLALSLSLSHHRFQLSIHNNRLTCFQRDSELIMGRTLKYSFLSNNNFIKGSRSKYNIRFFFVHQFEFNTHVHFFSSSSFFFKFGIQVKCSTRIKVQLKRDRGAESEPMCECVKCL